MYCFIVFCVFVLFPGRIQCPEFRQEADFYQHNIISYSYGTIQPVCAESVVKHQSTKQHPLYANPAPTHLMTCCSLLVGDGRRLKKALTSRDKSVQSVPNPHSRCRSANSQPLPVVSLVSMTLSTTRPDTMSRISSRSRLLPTTSRCKHWRLKYRNGLRRNPRGKSARRRRMFITSTASRFPLTTTRRTSEVILTCVSTPAGRIKFNISYIRTEFFCRASACAAHRVRCCYTNSVCPSVGRWCCVETDVASTRICKWCLNNVDDADECKLTYLPRHPCLSLNFYVDN